MSAQVFFNLKSVASSDAHPSQFQFMSLLVYDPYKCQVKHPLIVEVRTSTIFIALINKTIISSSYVTEV